MKVLVAPLSAHANTHMITYLRRRHYEVIDAYNLNDAQLALNEGPPDCIITDLTGEYDGLEHFGPKLRAKSKYKYLGWQWVKDEVLPQYPYPERIIFFSADICRFKNDCPGEDIGGFCIIDMFKGEAVKLLAKLREIETLGRVLV